MFGRLVILFVAVPLIELYLLLRVNEWTGSALTTIGLILVTGVLGAWLARRQGFHTLRKIQQAFAEGRLPSQELMDGAMILVAGALLVTPGVLTDAFGFSLLLPPCRAIYRIWLRRIPMNFQVQTFQSGFSSDPSDDPSVVEGTARPVDPKDSENTP